MINEPHTDSPYRLGAAAMTVDAYEDARTAFRKAIEKNPSDALALRDLGWLMYGIFDDTQEALRLFERAKACDSRLDYLDMYNALALVEAERYHEAEAAFKDALENSSYLALVHAEFAEFLAARGRTEEAEEHFLNALRLDGQSSLISRKYARLLAWLKRNDEADNMYQKALKLDPCDLSTKRQYQEFVRAIVRS